MNELEKKSLFEIYKISKAHPASAFNYDEFVDALAEIGREVESDMFIVMGVDGRAAIRKDPDYKASRQGGNTGENLLSLVESRLDNVVYRLGFANSRRQARQLVNHGHFTVNGGRVNIPSYLVKTGDVIAVCEKSASNNFFKGLKEADAFVAAPKWLDRDKNTLTGKVIATPTKADIDFDIAVHLIVELYSK